jgi:cytidine deaminase
MCDLNEEQLAEMILSAKNVSKVSYSPYSKFPVGAAVITKDGQIFKGCNVENASYGLSICAERTAIFHMVAQGKRQIAAVVIYTPTATPATPCGACRQVISEFGPDALIIGVCDGPAVFTKKLSELLPAAFGPDNLGEPGWGQ